MFKNKALLFTLMIGAMPLCATNGIQPRHDRLYDIDAETERTDRALVEANAPQILADIQSVFNGVYPDTKYFKNEEAREAFNNREVMDEDLDNDGDMYSDYESSTDDEFEIINRRRSFDEFSNKFNLSTPDGDINTRALYSLIKPYMSPEMVTTMFGTELEGEARRLSKAMDKLLSIIGDSLEGIEGRSQRRTYSDSANKIRAFLNSKVEEID